jgi:GMP synthase (glutamine-hydrolysing)
MRRYTPTMEPVLLIGHDRDETFGLAPPALEVAGVETLEYRVGIDELPPLEEVSGIVMFGGEMNVDMTDRYPFLADERRFVREAVDRGIPYLGICLGAQMLARALDRNVYAAGVREIGFNALHPAAEAQRDRLVAVFEDGDMVFHWHEDTFELPEGAALLATGDHVPMQAFRVGERAWGLQFHFEVDRPEVEQWLKSAGEDVVRAWGKTTEQVLAESDRYLPQQEERARELFRRFAGVVRTARERR